jgi:hypothetical protein
MYQAIGQNSGGVRTAQSSGFSKIIPLGPQELHSNVRAASRCIQRHAALFGGVLYFTFTPAFVFLLNTTMVIITTRRSSQ